MDSQKEAMIRHEDGLDAAANVPVTAHTPTPWRSIDSVVVVTVEDHGFATWLANCQVGGNGRDEQYANAAFIVRAVNAHDMLVIALRHALAEIHNPGAANHHEIDLLGMIDAALWLANSKAKGE